MQLVTRDCVLQEAFNSTHVALPVQCGFEDFMRAGQLLWPKKPDKGGKKGEEEDGGGRECKSDTLRSPAHISIRILYLFICPFGVISHMCLGVLRREEMSEV